MKPQCVVCDRSITSAADWNTVKGVMLKPLCSECYSLSARDPKRLEEDHPWLFDSTIPKPDRGDRSQESGDIPISTGPRLPFVFLKARYKDAYATAKMLNWFGQVIKVLFSLVVIGGLFVPLKMVSDQYPEWIAYTVMALGLLFGIFGFILGMVISGLSQVVLASVDNSINTSPLLSDEEKGSIMRL